MQLHLLKLQRYSLLALLQLLAPSKELLLQLMLNGQRWPLDQNLLAQLLPKKMKLQEQPLLLQALLM
jgi:hypothetical protein